MRRNEIIGAPLFRDPAWDMLLELFVAHQGGRPGFGQVALPRVGGPATTALRHLSLLEKHGLITRDGDAQDNRRWFIHPTDKAINGIARAASLLVENGDAVESGGPRSAG